MTITQDQDNHRTQSYELGFASGARAAQQTPGHQLSCAEMRFVAHSFSVEASKSVIVDRAEFERGWQAGYLSYFECIL